MIINVTPGEIEVDRVDRVLDTEHAKAWHVDLVSKYAEIGYYSRCGNEAGVHLWAVDRTLYVVEELRKKPTDIMIGAPDGWIVLAECARYTCRIVAYNPYGEADSELAAADSTSRPAPKDKSWIEMED